MKLFGISIKPLTLMIGVLFIAIVVVVTAFFVPSETNPAYAVAVNFAKAAGKGDDASALPYLAPALQTYVQTTCRDQSVSACVDDYTPAEWGKFLTAVYRRAQPDGKNAWDVQLVATYEKNQGFSGVCIYVRVEQLTSEEWVITHWAGWMSCDEPNSGLSNLISDTTVPHRAP